MIFLDTSNLDKIKKYQTCGIIRGVTTNPTILHREGGYDRQHLRKIARTILPSPLSVEIRTNDPTGMIRDAQDLQLLGNNIVVKIPIHGPNDANLSQNLNVIHALEYHDNIRVNVTAMMSAQQGYLAALAGATYVSLFGGRVNNIGYDACAEIAQLRYLINVEDLPAKIIVGSTREVINIIQLLDAGAHIVTVTPDLLEKMIWHPYTELTVRQFLDDAKE